MMMCRLEMRSLRHLQDKKIKHRSLWGVWTGSHSDA
jgi:hypothetical protein